MRSLCSASMLCLLMTMIIAITLLSLVNVIHADETRSPIKAGPWSALQVTPPDHVQDEPWLICLLTEGPHLIYTAQLYTVQSRYRSWTVDWRRYRPQGYVHDEEVGLITTLRLQRSLDQILGYARQYQLKPRLTSMPPPCSTEEIEQRPISLNHQDSPSITTRLWVLSPHTTSATSMKRGRYLDNLSGKELNKSVGYRWYFWHFDDPHLQSQSGPRELIKIVQQLVHQAAPDQNHLDRLLKLDERGILILKVSQPSTVWINGVYHGRWPSRQVIYLPEDYYTIHVAPLDSHYEPVSYEEVEILAGRQTTFRIEVE